MYLLRSILKLPSMMIWCLINSILLGVLYIPPPGSVNLDEDEFEYGRIFWKRVLRVVDVEWNGMSFNNYDVTI